MTKDDQHQEPRSAKKEPDENETLGLPWPESYKELLPLIRERWGIKGTLYLNRKLSGGRSGALVYAADLESQKFTGQAILKLDSTPDSSWYEQHEADLHHQAISDAPEFSAQHLPRLLHTLHHNKQIAVLSAIAGRGLQYAKPWIDCVFEKQLQMAREVSRGILEDWNQNYRRQSGLRHPRELLQSWLGHRLDPEHGGQIQGFLSTQCSLAPDVPSITFEGQWYPNPLAFALGNEELPDHLRLRMITGHIHGDFHGQNLLIGRPQSPESDYYLIDLALYKGEQYLFYDHAYFEIAFLLNSRANISASDWETLLRQQLKSDSHSGHKPGLRTDDIGLIELVRSIRQEVSVWIDRHEGDRLSYMDSQYLLARVAVGLNFTNKNLPDEMRRRAFIYAAFNLKDYMRLNSLDWPKHGPPFLLDEVAQQDFSTEKADIAATPNAAEQPAGSVQETARTPPLDKPESEPSRGRINSLMNELQRRHVVKVAGLYLIVAWLCVQIATALKVPLLLPAWTDSLVTVLLVLGFPIACIFAWAFEMSPGGIKRTVPAESDNRAVPRKQGIVDFIIVAGIIGLLIFSVWQFEFDYFEDKVAATSGNGPPSIAVLPFRNLSEDGTDDNFSDGLTIEIMAALARTGQFRIPGQTSTFRYKNQEEDLRKIGHDLGVQYLLDGSVRRVDNDIRVEAQLTEAENGFLVWSNVYSDEIKDIFVIQEKIANSIGNALKTPLGVVASGLQTNRTSNPEAYELFLNALALASYRGDGLNSQIAKSIELLSESVKIDPNFAVGWAALSLAYDFGVVFPQEVSGRTLTPAVYIRRSSAAAVKARELNPELAIVNHALANVYRRARQWTSAEDFYRKALQRQPNNVLAMMDYARMLSIVGHDEKAIAMSESVKEIDPRHPLIGFTKSQYELQANPTKENYEKHLEQFGQVISLAPFVLRSTMGYLDSSGQMGRLKELLINCSDCDHSWRDPALSMIDDLASESAETIYDKYGQTRFLGYPMLQTIGGKDLVLKAFENNSNNRSFNFQAYLVPWINVKDVGQSEKFQVLIEDIGLDDYWRERGWPKYCKPLEGESFECGG